MPEIKAERPSLAGLTSLRFFAATYVLLFHVRGGTWFRAGFTGVSLFFVLSGFILAYNHPTVVGAVQRKKFYLSRFARIYPLYFVSYLLSLVFWLRPAIAARGLSYIVKTSVMYLLVLQAWYPPYFFAVNAGAWTLVVEFFFYALFPFVVGPMARFQSRWRTTVLVLYGLLLAPTVLVDFYLYQHFPQYRWPMHGTLMLPIFHLGEFLIGITLGLRFLRHRPVFNGWVVLAATAFVLVALAIAGPLSLRANDVVFDGAMALPYAVLIYSIAGWKSRWFGGKWLQLGGEISFSLYLLQGFFVEAVQWLFHGSRRYVPLRFGLLLVFAYLTYRFIEKPARKWILNRFGVRTHPKPIETPGVAIP